jgi:hypothetical protein
VALKAQGRHSKGGWLGTSWTQHPKRAASVVHENATALKAKEPPAMGCYLLWAWDGQAQHWLTASGSVMQCGIPRPLERHMGASHWGSFFLFVTVAPLHQAHTHTWRVGALNLRSFNSTDEEKVYQGISPQ